MYESGRVKRKNKLKSQRKYCIRPGRSNEWWNGFVKDEILPDKWKDNFRISKESFYILCGKLRPYIVENTTRMRKLVNVEKQVAVVFYHLVDESCMRKTANIFSIVKCTISKTIHRVTKAINTYLGSKFIKLPITEEEVTESCRRLFENFDSHNILDL